MNQAQFSTMLTLQARLNAVINPHWLNAGYPFLRAVVVEGGESIQHHGFKWWKKEAMNVGQLRLELIDILHFVLSSEMVAASEGARHAGDDATALAVAAAAERMEAALARERDQTELHFDGRQYVYDDLSLIERLELITGLAVSRRTNMRLLLDAWVELGGSVAELYATYVGKNTLNIFRQRHGDKGGHYIKIWDGREDNVHLEELMATLSPSDLRYAELLYAGLATRYSALTVQA